MQAKLKCRLSLNKAKSEPGSGRALLLQSKAQEILGDISMCMPNILSTCSLVYLIRPTSLPTYSGTGRIYFFSLLEFLSDLSRQSSRSLQTPLHSAGVPIWGIPRFLVLGPMQNGATYLCFGAQSCNFGPPSLIYSIMCHQVMVTMVSTHRAGLIPTPVSSSSGSVPMATNSRHSHKD